MTLGSKLLIAVQGLRPPPLSTVIPSAAREPYRDHRCVRAITESRLGPVFSWDGMTREHHYWIYIVGSISGTLYTGVTNDLLGRSTEHQSGEGSEFTARYHCDRLLYFEFFRYVRDAIRREKQIKSWRRSKKVALIESVNPAWRDLSKDLDVKFRGPIGIPHCVRYDRSFAALRIGMCPRYSRTLEVEELRDAAEPAYANSNKEHSSTNCIYNE